MPRTPLFLLLTLIALILPLPTHAYAKCRIPGISLVWKRETGLGPSTVAPPYMVTAAPAHYVSLIDVHTAKSLPGWPFSIPAATFSAAPLILDYDGDGQEEVLVFTTDGVIMGVTMEGVAQASQTQRLGSLELPRKWYEGMDSPNVRASLSLLQRPNMPLSMPAIPPSRAALQASMPAALNFTGMDKWLPKEGVESLSLFLRHSHAVQPRAHGTPGEGAFEGATQQASVQHTHLKGAGSVLVPPHILTTPVAADMGDGATTLLIPVSYFINFDSTEEREALSQEGLDARKYVAGGIVAVSKGQVLWHREFDVTVQDQDVMRAYMRTAPVPIDLDRDGKSEVATDSGRLYVLNHKGEPVKWGAFPLEHTLVLATPVADDLQGDGEVEIIVLEMLDEDKGRVRCYDHKGAELWSNDFVGAAVAEPILVHLDRDGVLDVAWGTTAGVVYAVRGDTGQLLPNFPVALGRTAGIHAPLRTIMYGLFGSTKALVAPCADGYLAFVGLPTGCVDRVDLAEPLMSPIFLGDFSHRGVLELLVPSTAGHAYLIGTDAVHHPSQAWHSRARGAGVQHHRLAWQDAYFTLNDISGGRAMNDEISGTDVPLQFTIVDGRKPTLQGRAFGVTIKLDSHVIWRETYSASGAYSVSAALPDGISEGHHILTIRMRNELGQESGDSMSVTVAPRTERVVRWLVLVPLVTLFALLRLARESPDLLPQ